MMNRSRVALTLLVILSLSSTATAAEPTWEIGLARRDITPQGPVFLSGYASRNRPSDGVASPLFVKALAIGDTAGHRAVIITCDIIGYRQEVSDPICERIIEQTGLERKDILLSASHTHTGPHLLLDFDNQRPAYEMSAEQAKTQIDYTKTMMDHTVAVAVESIENMSPARLGYTVGWVPFVMNRREWTPGGIQLGFNPSGYADRSVPMLRIDNLDGTLRGVLFGAAAHGTTLTGQNYVISGDYAAFAQQYIERQHPDAQAMFILGCAGSANPYPRGTLALGQQHGETLGKQVVRLLDAKQAPVTGPLTTRMEAVDLPLQDPPTREQLDRNLSERGPMRASMARQMVAVLESGESLPTEKAYPLSVWQFGEDLTLVGLSGEVVGEFVPLIEQAIRPGRLWIAAYCHDVFGYVVTAHQLEEGGYETRGTYYGAPGVFSGKAEGVLVDQVRRMAEQVGRLSNTKNSDAK